MAAKPTGIWTQMVQKLGRPAPPSPSVRVRTMPKQYVPVMATMPHGVGVAANQSGSINAGLEPSNQRFRSFAERYLVERAHQWPVDANIEEIAHATILQARTVYNMIKETGRTVKDE